MTVNKLLLLSRRTEKFCEKYLGISYTKKTDDFSKPIDCCTKTMTLTKEI